MKALKLGIVWVTLSAAPLVGQQSRIDPESLIGTWQLILRKNLRTGAIDSVVNRRLAWEGFTRNTYHVYEMDLAPAGTTKEALRVLPPQERRHKHLDAVNYVARGGMYQLVGNEIRFRRVMSLDPNEIGTMPVAIVDSVNANWMFRRTVPDTAGVVTEQLYKRVQ